jgi:hypothetical protein
MPGILNLLTSSGLTGPSAVPMVSLTGTLPWSASTSAGKVTPSGLEAGFVVTDSSPILPVTSSFFPFLTPKGQLWDKLIPYRLVVMDVSHDPPVVVSGSKPSAVSVNPLGNGTLSFEAVTSAWEFFLPITPQQLSITDAYAINTSATLRGVLEEHSGVRFKNITIQGTFGVWPGRASIYTASPQQGGALGALQSVFGGTISAINDSLSKLNSIATAFTTGSLSSKPKTVRPGDSGDPDNGLSTSYYQTLMLTQFLEQYAEAKRNPANAGWRLVFDIPKQNQSFVVTPVGFTWNENVNKPMEINYNLQLKAWRRINLKDKLPSVPLQVTPLSPNILQQITNTISAAQITAASAVNLIGAVRSDVDNILNIIRQTGIFVKQLYGIGMAASDMANGLVKDCNSTISQFASTLSISGLTGKAATDTTVLGAIAAMKTQNATNEGVPTPINPPPLTSAQFALNAAAGKALSAQLAAAAIATNAASSVAQIAAAKAAAASAALAAAQQANEYNNIVAQINAQTLASTNPASIAFQNPLRNPLLFSQVPISALTLNPAQQAALQNEVDTVNSFTVADLKIMRGTILTLCTQLSNSFGAGNAYYSVLFNQPTPLVRNEPMTLDEYNILQSFYELVQAYDVLTATNQIDNNQILNNMEYVSALAATSGIPFSTPNSKIQVPVPFGLNIEQISMRYLNDPQRWIEIATLNFLREPYIDENGFVYSLLSNADGRNIVIGSIQDLFVGQTIYLNSNTQSATARTIINIVTLSQTSFLLTLDGLPNLDGFATIDQAYIQAYLPGTVNSQNVIWMPSDLPTSPDDQINIPSSVANVKLVGLSKVDWLLTPQGDIAIDNVGDFRLAAGITNLVQALTIKFSTQVGTCLLNPDFGLNVKPGIMVSDTSASDVYNEIVGMITADPRFSGISGLQVTIQPPSMGISLGIGLSGIQGIFPVSFQLPMSS